MPSHSRVAVESSPKLYGIYDTINAVLAAADPRIRLPNEFFDPKAREIMDRILMEEEYSGYHENREYRRLGIGPILGEVVQSMVNSAAKTGRRNRRFKLWLYGTHDSTLAAALTSLKAEEWGGDWPPYTSSLAIELFKRCHDPEGSFDDLRTHYVRLRYNGSPIKIPGCGQPGHHLDPDRSFCTLVGCTSHRFGKQNG